MYVCICNAITESQIIEARDSGLTNMRQITKHLGVGNCCGQCIESAQELLNDDNPVGKYLPPSISIANSVVA